MKNNELQRLVENISQTCFRRTFDHNAVFNARLRTTGGRYLLQSHNIEINPKMLTEHDMETLIGVIKHELVHYHLHLQQLPFNHHSKTFKQLLAQVRGLEFAPRSPQVSGNKYQYRCSQCQQVYVRKRKVDLQKYVCGRCRGKLQLI